MRHNSHNFFAAFSVHLESLFFVCPVSPQAWYTISLAGYLMELYDVLGLALPVLAGGNGMPVNVDFLRSDPILATCKQAFYNKSFRSRSIHWVTCPPCLVDYSHTVPLSNGSFWIHFLHCLMRKIISFLASEIFQPWRLTASQGSLSYRSVYYAFFGS